MRREYENSALHLILGIKATIRQQCLIVKPLDGNTFKIKAASPV